MQTLEKTNLVFSKVCIEMTIVEKQYSRRFHSEGLTIFRETFFFVPHYRFTAQFYTSGPKRTCVTT